MIDLDVDYFEEVSVDNHASDCHSHISANRLVMIRL